VEEMSETVRRFSSGATRDGKDGKINPEGALSPLVLRRFAEYMLEKQKLPDGTLRGADNWQLGIPRQAYMESICRHWLELWTAFRLMKTDKLGAQFIPEALEDLLCALFFNVQGLLHEVLLRRDVKDEPAKPPAQYVLRPGFHPFDEQTAFEKIPTVQGLAFCCEDGQIGIAAPSQPIVSEVQFPSQGQENSHGQDRTLKSDLQPLDIHGGQVEGPTKVTLKDPLEAFRDFFIYR
jgi:hypothetical protein